MTMKVVVVVVKCSCSFYSVTVVVGGIYESVNADQYFYHNRKVICNIVRKIFVDTMVAFTSLDVF